MKRILTILLLAFLFQGIIIAQKITEQQALAKAQTFMKDKIFANKISTLKRAKVSEGNEIENALFVFNAENGGYVIVSSDERTEEILGYSDSGHLDLDNLPENLKYWLESYKQQILSVDNRTCQKVKRAKRQTILPLIQTTWDQTEPYNWDCPEIGGKKCPTGCVATAMAQVLCYLKCPQQGTPEIPGYTISSNIALPALPPTKFDWDKMKNYYGSFIEDNPIEGIPSYTREEGEAVAKLMRYCGQAVKMHYNVYESAAAVRDIDMMKYFGISNTAENVSRVNYSNTDWENLIYNEVSEGRPVLYGGSQKFNAGHEFVCDGYDGDGFFHINWGWGPNDNGYYLLSILDPLYKESYDGYISEGFSSSQGAIIGLQPITDNEQIEKKCYVRNLGWGTTGIYFGPGLFKNRENSDSDFTLLVDAYLYTNKACMDFFPGEIAFNIYKDENFISTCYWVKDLEKETDNDGRSYWKVSFGAGYDNGDYTLKVFYKSEDGNLYEADCHDMIIATIDGDRIDIARKSKNPNPLITNYVVNSIEYGAPSIIDEENSAVISLTNTGESHAQEVCFYIGDYEYALSNGTSYLEPGETGTVKLKFTPNTYGKKKVEIASTRPKFTYNKQNEKIPDPNYHALYEGLINIYAKSNIYFNDVYCVAGQQKIINVYFQKIDCDIKKAQFSVNLPEGLTIQTSNINNENASVVQDELGKWIISIDNILNYDDKIFSIPIVANNDLESGDYIIKVDNVEIYDTNDEQISLLAFESKIKVGKDPISSDATNIYLSEAGTLSYYIDDKYNVEEMKITGEINGTDLRFIRDMSGNNYLGELTNGKLKVLDISEAKIVAGGEMYLDTDRIKSREPNSLGHTGSFHFTVTDDFILPKDVFEELLLSDIKLPETLKSMESYALGFTTNIRKLLIPFGVSSLGDNIGLKNLEEIIIPSSINSIRALSDCKNLKRVVLCYSEMVNWTNMMGYDHVTFVVKRGLKEKYQNNRHWKNCNFTEEDFITIKVNPITITEGENIPTFTYSVEGGDLIGEPHFYCESDGKTPGVYDIIIMQGSISNENVIFENGKLTVEAANVDAIFNIDGENNGNNMPRYPKNIYDIHGRKISYPRKGIYIIDGNKILKK